MAWIRFDLRDKLTTPAVPSPDEWRVIEKTFGRCKLMRVVLGPQTLLCVSKGRHATLRGNTGACEHANMPGISERVD